ncbi:hypothetical protein KMT30_40755 [Streptomyces sp. IBSBF 2953]|uniref:hypothetical protein n=1 Tax=Streptomyces TaxID=1883 RepID=UPI002119FE30|nr:hypothetical protein [Streptomyces scabiei]MCQ9185256.1 hypothetical protein [Streptomyces hayashii]MDX3114670.1 hypothetical protein [Streptomyces scabiei]
MPGLELEPDVGQKAAIRRYFQFATMLLVIGLVLGIIAAATGFTGAWVGVAIIVLIWVIFAMWYRSQKR